MVFKIGDVMTKWVENKDVEFTCQRDIYEYILDKKHGVKYKSSGAMYYFTDTGFLGVPDFCFIDTSKWTPMKRAEWYEDIPEKGVLCWVGFNQVSLIKTYKDGWFYSVSGMYKEATPLTKEEVMQYILPD